jgi:hypothetical protein
LIERAFDIPFVADLAVREKQIQQNYRPIIAVHKWFARRPGTLFRALLLSEFSKVPLRESFYQANRLDGLRIADPFMGGGTPLDAINLWCERVTEQTGKKWKFFRINQPGFESTQPKSLVEIMESPEARERKLF